MTQARFRESFLPLHVAGHKLMILSYLFLDTWFMFILLLTFHFLSEDLLLSKIYFKPQHYHIHLFYCRSNSVVTRLLEISVCVYFFFSEVIQ